jgi:hypothetical protein
VVEGEAGGGEAATDITNLKYLMYFIKHWPLEPEFAASNPAEAVGFFGHPENPQYAVLRRGSKIICGM